MTTHKLFRLFILSILFFLNKSYIVAQPSVQGTWSPVYTTDMIAGAAANLPNGKILAWSARAKVAFGGDAGMTYTTIFDPATNSFSPSTLITNTGHDMFCPGTANLPNGEVMVTGGSSSAKTSFYDPINNSWRIGPEMNIPRGYHAMATLTDGRVFTVGGSWSGGQMNKKAEIWSEDNGWQTLNNVDSDNTVRQGAPDPGGIYRDDNHAWLFAAPGGDVYQVGPGSEMHYITTSGAGSVTDLGTRANNPYSMNGNAIMFDAGKVLTFGGAQTYANSTAATNQTHIINLLGNATTVTPSGNLNKARVLHNGVVLPSGEVVAISGLPVSAIFSDNNAILTPEIWNPVTGTWTEGVDMAVPRNYHSSAILMQDGRVWTGGGGLCGGCSVNHPDAEIYTPPYLYNANNQLATRPVIQSAPATASNNSIINVSTNSTIQDFVLMRHSSCTHSINNEQRRIPLTFNNIGGNNYALNIPNNDWLLSGYYFLFAMNNNGVPSIAKVIKISNDGGNSITNGLNATYYNNSDFTGTTFNRLDPQINFNWGTGSPHSSIGADTYSARWEGFIEAPTSGTYTFYTRTDDGVRLWVNNQQIINHWVLQPPTEVSGTIQLTAGQKVPIKMEYYENGGGAVAQLSWQGPGLGKQIVPSNNLFTNSSGGGCTNEQNLALGKPATQSSSYSSSFPASKANDGATGGNNFNHTQYNANAWWEVDLGAVYDLTTIKIFNRTNCCASRLNDFHVLVSDTPFNSTGLSATINQSGVSDYHFPGAPSSLTNFSINRSGRYVRVQLSGSNYLHMEEVQVFGCSNNNSPGLNATYYNNADFTGTTFNRLDPQIDFNWGTGSPHSSIGADTYSARWEGFIEAPASGNYTFYTRTDDGVRLWVNNQQIINHWVLQPPTEVSGLIQLTAGQKVPIKMEYYENGGGAVAQLSWKGPGISKQIIPTNYLSTQGGGGSNPSACDFTLLPGAALDIGSGGGHTFVVGTNRRIYKWNGSGWSIQTAGPQANRIDIESNGTPWVIATDGKIYRLVNNQWQQINGWASDVGCGANNVFVIGGQNKIYKWNGGNGWSQLSSGAAKRIDVWQDGTPWVVGMDDRIYQRIGNSFYPKGNFTARDIGLQEGGQRIWASAKSDGLVHNYLGSGVWEAHSGNAEHISVSNNGDVWIVNPSRQILINDCPAIPRSELSQAPYQLYTRPISGRQVSVQWLVNQRFTPEHYVLEYANNDGSFEALETIFANTSTDVEVYQTIHQYPISGNNHYQVRVVYENGVEDIIPFQTVSFEEIASPIGIFPNPAQNTVNIDLTNYMDLKVEYSISTLRGEVLAQGRYENFHPTMVSLDLSLFKNGMYILSLKPENRKRVSERLVISKDY